VSAVRIVEALDVAEDRESGVVTTLEAMSLHELRLDLAMKLSAAALS
jgi:hypothetical protein